MSIPIIGFDEGEARLDWLRLTEALAAGHRLPEAEIGDTFLRRGGDTLLSRAAWIDGLGALVKTATIHPGNTEAGLPTINGAVSLFDDRTGVLKAMVDFHLVTKWKTAGDSLLGALRLARKDARNVLIVGAGTVARSLFEAFGAGFPDARFTVWNRTRAKAEALAADCPGMAVAGELEAAVRAADIVVSATMATEPVIRGDWLQPGQHLNLIGAYRADMREVDDAALQRGRVFVDSFDTTIGHIGEIAIPLKSGAIAREDLLADFYQPEAMTRQREDEITVFKNGGGAHLDLMTAQHILDQWSDG
ncbi:MAG: ornithine cyclodeaminase [Marinovum algicola]|uniref:Ornithine cyclodeaminase n=1 Tax=Marinovum algicola TaxID=42444 RepID=A0A975WAW2_9RHOB|nr:ornithine cyclodeaminase [Marinovum algicola]SEJ65205.1 ornithine cyclodeaminase [Marinovum algicola]SLN53247.1 ornithine cyclodeaminase [Marinovum algicola]